MHNMLASLQAMVPSPGSERRNIRPGYCSDAKDCSLHGEKADHLLLPRRTMVDWERGSPSPSFMASGEASGKHGRGVRRDMLARKRARRAGDSQP